MKNQEPYLPWAILACLVVLISNSLLKGQEFYEWGEKEPLTDSVSNNTNPFLYHGYNGAEAIMIMTWENSSDTASSAIYFKDLLLSGQPQIVAADPGIHYTQPKILHVDNNDSLFYLFYESDQGGDQDIYYKKYTSDGNFHGPFPLDTGEFDQKDFHPGNAGYWGKSHNERFTLNTMAWTSGGNLVTCNLEYSADTFTLTDPVLLDSGNCSSPVIINDEFIYYIREDDTGSFIYMVEKIYPSWEWDDPEVFYNDGDCYNLCKDIMAFGPMYITWSADSSGLFRNVIASSWPPFYGYSYGPLHDAPLDPAVTSVVIGVRPEDAQFDLFYLAFPYPENENDEIFMNPDFMFPGEFLNFSQSGTSCRNPGFYMGEHYPWNWACFYVYLVWEELRNGHWQIFHSKTIMCLGGIEDHRGNNNQVKIYPNPFRDGVTIDYHLNSKEQIRISVFDVQGKEIKVLNTGGQAAGHHQVWWDGCDEAGNLFPAGLYLVRLSCDGFVSSLRVIKSF
jgi:hypothetical protein